MSEQSKPPGVLLSDGVVGLRRIEQDDASYFLKMRNDLKLAVALMGYRGGVSSATVTAWIEQSNAKPDEYNFTAVDLKDNQQPIGYAKAFRIDSAAGCGWVGLSLFDRDNIGRGYGGSILRLLIAYLVNEIGLRKISLEVLANNERAIVLYQKIGFVEEGRLREQYYHDGSYHDVLIMSRFAKQ